MIKNRSNQPFELFERLHFTTNSPIKTSIECHAGASLLHLGSFRHTSLALATAVTRAIMLEIQIYQTEQHFEPVVKEITN